MLRVNISSCTCTIAFKLSGYHQGTISKGSFSFGGDPETFPCEKFLITVGFGNPTVNMHLAGENGHFLMFFEDCEGCRWRMDLILGRAWLYHISHWFHSHGTVTGLLQCKIDLENWVQKCDFFDFFQDWSGRFSARASALALGRSVATFHLALQTSRVAR